MDESRQDPHGESSASELVAAIEAALGALRGRGPGGPGAPWAGRSGPTGAPWAGRGGPFGPGGPGRWGDEHDSGEHHHEHHDHHGAAHGRRPPRPPLPPHGRGGPAALRLLAALAAGGPQSVNDLAVAVGVDQPRASRLVRAAVEAGHVRREVDPADARRSILAITDAGRGALQSTLGRRRAAIETALSGFTPEERAEFARLLQKFAAAWPG